MLKQWANALLYSCPTHPIPLQYAIVHAMALSIAFVGSLYILVPAKIRRLDRDDDIHIRWRLIASASCGFACVAVHPLVVCISEDNESTASHLSALELLGMSAQIQPVLQVLLHTVLLYFGANVATILQIHELVRRQRRQGKLASHFGIFKTLCIEPIYDPFWQQLRNLFLAPASEELVFRACLVGPLVQAISSRTKIAWIAPLFFGTAHLHHAYLKWKEHNAWKPVVFVTILQFTYTTLFGAYVTHAFLRTRSLPAIIISHQYCNYMGLPDLSFLKPQFGRLSIIYEYRYFVLFLYVVGVGGFVWGFNGLLP
jgi:prenyl protein peptidase